jgi:mRNA interferase MazF
LTSGSHPAPFRIACSFRRNTGLILLDQIRTVDRQRCISRMGVVDDVTLQACLSVLSGMFAS